MRMWRLRIEGLTPERSAELSWFCRQYPQKRAALAAMRGGFNSFDQDGQPRGRGRAGNPTARRAMRALESKERRDVAMIESAAREATGGSDALYRALIKNVCEGVQIQHISVPMGLRQYHALRRRFFLLLDRAQRGG